MDVLNPRLFKTGGLNALGLGKVVVVSESK